MSQNLESVPEELRNRRQWVAYRPDKTPVNPRTGGNAQADNPATWGTYAKALKHYKANRNKGIAGIGFMFCADDPYAGTDIDHCRDLKTGQLKYCAQVLI